MGYYIRILGTNLAAPMLAELQQVVQPAIIETSEGADQEWEKFVLKHASEIPIALVEKNLVAEGNLGSEEIAEFLDEIGHYKPESAVHWLRGYLPHVKVIYAFQLLSGTDMDDGSELMHRAFSLIWKNAGGILQADLEGFSNEAGNTILWQFTDAVTGEWNAAVLDGSGNWVNFEMDLGNQRQREAFWRGEVPPEAKILSAG